MVAETILKNLGIDYPGSYTEDGKFVVNMDSDTKFGKVYAAFDHSDTFEPSGDNEYLSADEIHLEYNDPDSGVKAEIKADFDKDIYTLTLYED